MTFDQLHTELRGRSFWLRRMPNRITKIALRSVVQAWQPMAPEWFGDKKNRRWYVRKLRKLVCEEARTGSIGWVIFELVMLAIKIIIPLLIDWWNNREENTQILEAMKC